MYTYHSNAIEGNTLMLQETAIVLEGMTVDQKPLKDHLVGFLLFTSFMTTLCDSTVIESATVSQL